jgi:O-methyltransferase
MIKKAVRGLFRRAGFDLVRSSQSDPFPGDFDEDAVEIIRAVSPYTMTNAQSQFALIEATRYVVLANIPGSIVECGVWRGGSMMAVAHTLKRLGRDDRDLYLFDTYEGMPRPGDVDISRDGSPALRWFERHRTADDTSDWAYASIEEVQRNLAGTAYNPTRLKFIKGKVEDTIPRFAPTQLSLLRLDTDWYESTRHELVHLFPRLAVGGVLIIDDYGFWQGCKKAADEYFAENNTEPILLNRIDGGARIAVKL